MIRRFLLTLAVDVCRVPRSSLAGSIVCACQQADYSQEAYVNEQMSTKVTFDQEGKQTREQTTCVSAKTDTGVQPCGLLSLPSQSATETVDVGYVRSSRICRTM